MRSIILLSLIGTALFPLLSLAEDPPITVFDEVVVSATKIPTVQSRVASSVGVISSGEIERSGETEVSEVLRGSAGVDVVKSGGDGGNAAIFLRGANSEHTLVLLDGIELNSPINPTRAFNFSTLSLDDVDRIEVLRGPQSTLYGSDAMGGVINIFTRTGTEKSALSGQIEGGSYDTFSERASASGRTDNMDYSILASRRSTAGFSSADRRDGNKERDGFLTSSITGNVGQKLGETTELRTILRYVDSVTERDETGGVGGDDPNITLFGQDFFGRAQISHSAYQKTLNQTVGVGYSLQNFQDDNYLDESRPLDMLKSKYFGKLLKFDYRAAYEQSQTLTVLAGIESKDERGASALHSESAFGPFDGDFPEQSARTNSAYSQLILSPIDSMDASLGIRVDDHEEFGTKVTYRLAPVYRVESTGTKIFSTVGTGFKAPSLYELYSIYGSKELSPERSLGADAGLEQSFFNRKLTASATYFWNRFDDLISFDPATFLFENIAKARTDGVEIVLKASPSREVTVGVDTTFTNTEDESTGQGLLRRARSKVGGYVSYVPLDKLSLTLRGQYIGRRLDNDFSTFPAERAVLGGYSIFNIRAAYDLTDRVQLFARVENLLDRKYQEVLGFGTSGVAGFAGVKVNLG